MNPYVLKPCKLEFLSSQVGSISLGLDYKDRLILDTSYFDCCDGSSRLETQEAEVKLCPLRSRFSYVVELFREYSDLFELKESYLFYESQHVNILFFHKIYQSISAGNTQALFFSGSGIVGDHSRNLLPENMDQSLMSFFYGLALSWRFGLRVHYLRVGQSFRLFKRYKKNFSLSSMDWKDGLKKSVLFACITDSTDLTNILDLHSCINFCYNSKTFLVILDERQAVSENKEELETKDRASSSKRGSYFSKRISKIKSRPLLSYLDLSSQSKLKEMLLSSK